MKLVVGMLVKNEAGRYLHRIIQNICQFADELVVLDDRSEDSTRDVIRQTCTIPLQVHVATEGHFGNEITLRKDLYQRVAAEHPDWLMIIDADEICVTSRTSLRQAFEELMNDQSVDVWGFRFYDFWTETSFRADTLWHAHEYHTLMLARNISDYVPLWKETPHHCGRLPANLWSLRTYPTDLIKIKHYGWATEPDRRTKYQRYLQYDPHGEYGSLEKYESILDPNPNLCPWSDQEYGPPRA